MDREEQAGGQGEELTHLMKVNRIFCGALTLGWLLCMIGEAASENGKFSDSNICKAAVASIMGRDPAIIRIDRQSKPVVFLSYVRADDNKRWTYKCKIDGRRIIWATPEGRWRTHEADEIITFEAVENSLTIRQKFADGSESEDNYSWSQLSSE